MDKGIKRCEAKADIRRRRTTTTSRTRRRRTLVSREAPDPLGASKKKKNELRGQQ